MPTPRKPNAKKPPPPGAGKRGGEAHARKIAAERAKDPHGLLPQQRRFVEEMLIDGNQTRSARAAGYSWGRAAETGSELMDDPRVQAAVEDGRHALLLDLKARQKETLAELDALAHSSIDDYVVGEDGRVQLTKSAKPTAIKAVASAKFRRKTFVDEEGKETITEDHEIRLWDKNSALQKKMTNLGLLTERVAVGNPDGTPIAQPAMSLELLRSIVRAAKDEG
jgi:phage terminase small subunit